MDRASSRRGIKEDVISKIFVGNLSFDATRSEIENLFSEVGDIVEVFVPTDRNTGRPRGFAFVEFTDPAAVAAAIARFDGTELQGRSLRVSEAEERSPRPAPFGGGFAPGPRGPKPGKAKGSRRNLRKRKRGY